MSAVELLSLGGPTSPLTSECVWRPEFVRKARSCTSAFSCCRTRVWSSAAVAVLPHQGGRSERDLRPGGWRGRERQRASRCDIRGCAHHSAAYDARSTVRLQVQARTISGCAPAMMDGFAALAHEAYNVGSVFECRSSLPPMLQGVKLTRPQVWGLANTEAIKKQEAAASEARSSREAPGRHPQQEPLACRMSAKRARRNCTWDRRDRKASRSQSRWRPPEQSQRLRSVHRPKPAGRRAQQASNASAWRTRAKNV